MRMSKRISSRRRANPSESIFADRKPLPFSLIRIPGRSQNPTGRPNWQDFCQFKRRVGIENPTGRPNWQDFCHFKRLVGIWPSLSHPWCSHSLRISGPGAAESLVQSLDLRTKGLFLAYCPKRVPSCVNPSSAGTPVGRSRILRHAAEGQRWRAALHRHRGKPRGSRPFRAGASQRASG